MQSIKVRTVMFSRSAPWFTSDLRKMKLLVVPLSGSTKPLDLLFINWLIGTTKKLIQSPSKKHGHSTIQILFKIVLAILKGCSPP